MEVNSLKSGSVAQQIVGGNEVTNKAQAQTAAQKAAETDANKAAELPTSVLDGEPSGVANADPAVEQAPPAYRGQNVDIKA